MKNLKSGPSAILFSTLSIGVVHGQTAGDGIDGSGQPTSAGLDEIVVTAQRRSQSIQDIGIAVHAYSAAELEQKGISNSAELGLITPGVFVSGSAGGESSQFSIRGVTQSDFNGSIEAPVAVYTDETYIPSQQGQTLAAFDLDRVEILKGPQGTLFGRNATGGLVQFVVKKPTVDFSGDFNVDYGRFNLVKLEGGIGGPIVDGILFRIAALDTWHDDILTNVASTRGGLAAGSPTSYSGNLNPCCYNTGNDNSQAVRVQVQFTPADQLKIRLSGTYDQQKLDGAPTIERATIATVNVQGEVIQTNFASPMETRVAVTPSGGNVGTSEPGVFLFAPASGVRVPGADFFGFDGRTLGDLQTSLNFTGNGINTFSDYDGAVHIDYDFGGVSLASISDYKINDKQLFVDLAATPVNVGAYQTRAHTESFAQELRLGGKTQNWRWTTGAYFLAIDATSTQGLGAPSGSFLAAAFGLAEHGVDLSDNIRLRTRSTSVYGQAEYDFAPLWTLVVGLRGILEQQKYNFASVAVADSDPFHVESAPALFTLQPSFNNSRTQDLWAGKAQVEFRPEKDVLMYFGINRGVKAGSYNALILPPALPPGEIPYQPEELLTFEPGIKLSTLERRLTFDAAVFYYDYHNYQAFTFQSASGYVQNRDATNYGADVEITGRPTDSLIATISASVMHAMVKDVAVAPGVFRNVRPTYAPDQQVAASVQYTLPKTVFSGRLSLLLDGNYTSDFYNNITNFSSTRMSGYFLGNVGITWRDASGRWRVGGRVSNVLDKRYFGIGFDQTALVGGTQMQLGDPRWWKISVSCGF